MSRKPSQAPFLKGLVAGAAVAVATLVGYAYGTTRAEQPTQEELEARCRVQVGYGRYTGGYQCRFNEVMVGIQGGTILCADVTVDCPAQ